MKYFKILAIISTLLISFPGVSQKRSLRGKVFDSKSKEALPYASIFINGTTIGTNANETGEFILNNLPEGEFDLVCSFVGSEIFQIKSTQIPSSNYIEIRLKALELKEVEVTEKIDEIWNRQLKKFETLFLGQGKTNARILNPWVIDFSEIGNNVLVAKASVPIEIENLGLGYNVTYILKEFTVSPDAYNITGNSHFTEMESEDLKVKTRWKQARLKAFNVSERHLFQSIVNKSTETAGFQLFEDKSGGSQIMRSPFFSQELDKNIFSYKPETSITPGKIKNEFLIRLPARLEVHYSGVNGVTKYYRDVQDAIAWIEVKNRVLKVNERGVVLNPSNMVVSGYLTESRVAQLLPQDYAPEKDNAPRISIATGNDPSGKFIEKAYIQTDRAYYYPQETMWFKTYMNYSLLLARDSLSKVLYVDIVGNGKVIDQKILWIENGMAKGNFRLPVKLAPGDYYLRAYTNWMRNFDNENIFIKPFKILSLTESVQTDKRFKEVSKGIIISADKDQYSPYEKILLNVAVTDTLGNPVSAEISVGVTDLQQAVAVSNEKNIINSYGIKNITLTSKPNYLIERSLSYTGHFVKSSGKPDQGTLSVIEGKLENVFTVNTNEKGSFAFTNIYIEDSTQLRIMAKSMSGKNGRVQFDSKILPVTVDKLIPLDAPVGSFSGNQHYRTLNMEDTAAAELLPEVTVKSTSLPKVIPKNKYHLLTSIHGTPDVMVTGEYLRKNNASNLLFGLQSAVAGLRVRSFVGADGSVQYSIRIGSSPTNLSGSETTAPLVLINDVPLALPATDLAQYLSNLTPNEIDRVEILKFGKGAAYGTRGGNGVIAIYLLTSLPDSERPVFKTFSPKGYEVFTLKGYSSPKKFESPDYSINQPDVADFRTTIFWNPSLVTNQEGMATVSFYAAQLPTSYRIVVEGVTTSGEAVRGEKIIKIGDD